METRQQKIVEVHPSKAPEIGRWLWAMQDARQLTLEGLDGASPAMIDWLPGDNESSMGTVLYHLTDIEADWLYVEVLEQPMPPEIASLFSYGSRDKQGRLIQVQGLSLAEHLRRLELVRSRLLEAYEQMELEDFRRVRSLEHYDVTPEWVLHHLMQHEAEHRSQLGSLRIRAERQLTRG
jgi:uncharacterized damage-inducible protein DinB